MNAGPMRVRRRLGDAHGGSTPLRTPILILTLLVGCDDPGLTVGQIGQAPDQPRPSLCLDLSRVAHVIPVAGWANQALIEATAPDDNAGPELALLVSKFGLVKYNADPDVVNKETVFYSWNGRATPTLGAWCQDD